jgi:mono/diheme cytochrome c family protein
MMRMKGRSARQVTVSVGVAVAAAIAGCTALSGGAGQGGAGAVHSGVTSHVAAANAGAAGKYLVRISGCNDCHTPGYSQAGGNVPVALWLTGNPVGYRGPWGTSYASNLRLYVDPMSEDDWVRVMRARNDKPPMPWESLHAMSDPDLRAIYRFIKSLEQAGEPSPQDVPPGQEPKTPFVLMAPPSMPKR